MENQYLKFLAYVPNIWKTHFQHRQFFVGDFCFGVSKTKYFGSFHSSNGRLLTTCINWSYFLRRFKSSDVKIHIFTLLVVRTVQQQTNLTETKRFWKASISGDHNKGCILNNKTPNASRTLVGISFWKQHIQFIKDHNYEFYDFIHDSWCPVRREKTFKKVQTIWGL